MEPRKILALTAVRLLVAGGVCAQDSEGDANPPPQRPRFGGPEAQGPVTEEQRQARRDRLEGMSDEERVAAQGRGIEPRRPGGFTEEERQAMRERRGSMSDEERAVAREGAERRRGGRVPGGQSGGQAPAGGTGQGSMGMGRGSGRGTSLGQ